MHSSVHHLFATEDFMGAGFDVVHVIFNGINPNVFDGSLDPGAVKARYGIGPLDPMVLFCGRMTVQKGPDLLISAIPMILPDHPHAKFVFVGDGDLRSSCEHQAHGLGVAHACRFLGYRKDRELMELYKACDVVCVPSRNEPFGITILEAWSAEKPVVATKIGSPDEFIWHEVNGLKTDPHPESVAWGI